MSLTTGNHVNWSAQSWAFCCSGPTAALMWHVSPRKNDPSGQADSCVAGVGDAQFAAQGPVVAWSK